MLTQTADQTPMTDDFPKAMGLFQRYVDFEMIDQLQPLGPATVYTASITVWMLVYQRLNSNASLEAAVTELLTVIGDVSTNKRVRESTLSGNNSSYSCARSRLKVDVMNAVADHAFRTMLEATPPALLGRHVFVMDGTTLSLSSNNKLRERFPPGSNQYGPGIWPISHLVCAHELGGGLALRPEVGAMYGANADSELSLAQRMLPRIPEHSVLMADRNFGVFAFVYDAKRRGHDVVTRLTGPRFRKLLRAAEPEPISPGHWQVRWQPSRDDRKNHPKLPDDAEVAIHLYEFVGFSGQTIYAATTLALEVKQLASLYAKRWEIETEIRHLKRSLQMDALRGQSEAMILKELAGAMLSYNLVVQVRRLAAEQAGVPPKRISFRGVWSLVTIILLRPCERTPEEWQKMFAMVLRVSAQRKVPNRPGRSYEREVLPQRRKYPVRRRKKVEEQPK